MENLKQLLAAVAALTLVFSVLSSANPVYYSAFADDDDEEDERKITATFGESSKVELEIDDELENDKVMGELGVETEDGDLANGEHAVSFNCTSPALEQTFEESLIVREGEGEFEAEFPLVNGTTYEGCKVSIGELSVALPSFMVQAHAEDEEEEDDSPGKGKGHDATNSGRDDEDDEDERGSDRMRDEHKTKMEVDDRVAEFEVEVDTALANGTYDAVFTCDAPVVNMTLADAFEVEGGEGEFDMKIALANGTYTGCELAVEGTVIATFDSFTVAEEEEASDEDVDEKRKERRHEIVSNVENKRRMNAHPANPGAFALLNYTLTANGTAEQRMHDDEEDPATIPSNSTNSTTASPTAASGDVDVNINMTTWKSTRAIVLLNVIGGTVEFGDHTYDVRIGYALYSLKHDVMRINAFVTDEDGNVQKLKLRGSAVGEEAEFPAESGESIRMTFEGKTGGPIDRLGSSWDLELDGTIEAN